jgi:O-antigen ligase
MAAGYARWGRLDLTRVLLGALLLTVLVVEGAAVSHSYVWAAPLLALVVVAVAVDLPLVPLLGGVLLIRVLTDATLSSTTSRLSGAFNLSAAIAILFLLIAGGLMLRRRRGAGPALLVAMWLGAWTLVAIASQGASTVTIREGVREASMLAVALIVYNAPRTFTMPVVIRILQVAGAISAVVAIEQFASGTGVMINGEIRSTGTFTHPNGASMFFSIAAAGSVWRYFDHRRSRLDLLFAFLFAAATICTFSLSGLGALIAMLVVFGALRRRGSLKLMLGSYAAAALVVIAFLATPLGAERIANESETSLGAGHSQQVSTTSLGWRFYKWGLLLDEWDENPFVGHGLGYTVTREGTIENVTEGSVPHNEYLRYLVETGIFGAALILAALGALLSALKRRRPSDRSGAAILATAVVVGCLVNGLADNTFLYTTTGYAAAVVVAAALALPAPARARERRRARRVAVSPDPMPINA